MPFFFLFSNPFLYKLVLELLQPDETLQIRRPSMLDSCVELRFVLDLSFVQTGDCGASGENAPWADRTLLDAFWSGFPPHASAPRQQERTQVRVA